MPSYNFDKDLMNTSLVLTICADSHKYAESAAQAAFFLAERIEEQISMYKAGSDIYAINNAKVGDYVRLGEYSTECLALSGQVYEKTLGALDVCMGQFFTNAKNQTKYAKPSRITLKIDDYNFIAQKTSEGCLDFGAVGKGYAVDKIAELLKDEWSIENALIDFGSSTMLAIGACEGLDGWKVLLNSEDKNFVLKDGQALAGSGIRVQGHHIIDPLAGCAPKKDAEFIYAVASSGFLADAFSTAFMILDDSDIDYVCKANAVKCIKV